MDNKEPIRVDLDIRLDEAPTCLNCPYPKCTGNCDRVPRIE